jgi:hypothetical protein
MQLFAYEVLCVVSVRPSCCIFASVESLYPFSAFRVYLLIFLGAGCWLGVLPCCFCSNTRNHVIQCNIVFGGKDKTGTLDKEISQLHSYTVLETIIYSSLGSLTSLQSSIRSWMQVSYASISPQSEELEETVYKLSSSFHIITRKTQKLIENFRSLKTQIPPSNPHHQ